jgi:hypothetical protein
VSKPALSTETSHPTSGLVRPVSDDERRAYQVDGVALLSGIMPTDWLDYLRDGVDRLMARSDSSSQNYADDGEPRFFGQSWPWLLDDAFKDWALHGPVKDVARQIMPEIRSLNFFYDQIFAKEPGTSKATPWHQDFSYLPLKGDQILRIWVPLDRVTADGGAVHYLKGSHSWGTVFRPTPFKNISTIVDAYTDPPFDYAEPPDFDADHDKYDWLVGEVELGDAIVWQVLTVHGSGPNATGNMRRAITSVYTGDQVTWYPHSANMFKNLDFAGHVQMPDLEPGGPIDCELFPRVWTA